MTTTTSLSSLQTLYKEDSPSVVEFPLSLFVSEGTAEDEAVAVEALRGFQEFAEEVEVVHLYSRRRWFGQDSWGFFLALEGRLKSTTQDDNSTVFGLAFGKASEILEAAFKDGCSPFRCHLKGKLLPVNTDALSKHRPYHWQRFFSHNLPAPKNIVLISAEDAGSASLLSSYTRCTAHIECTELARQLNLCTETNEVEATLTRVVTERPLSDISSYLIPALYGPALLCLWQVLLHRNRLSPTASTHPLTVAPLHSWVRGLQETDLMMLHRSLVTPSPSSPMQDDATSIPILLSVFDAEREESEKGKEKEEGGRRGLGLWFYPVPLTSELDKSLVLLCDPTRKRTLGEREAFLAQQPVDWMKSWQEKRIEEADPSSAKKKKMAAFTLVHHDPSEGIFHYAGVLLPEEKDDEDDDDHQDKPTTSKVKAKMGTEEEEEEGGAKNESTETVTTSSMDEEGAKVEICFSFDTTGSMFGYLAEVRKSLKFLVQSLLLDIPSLRIAVIAHGDYCDRDKHYTLKRLDFSNDPDRLCDFVQGVEATGGGDSEECYELVLQDARTLSWTPAAMKALVVVADDVPHEKGKPATMKSEVTIAWKEELERLKEMGVHVYGVQCGDNDYANNFYSTMASMTEGAHLRLKQFKEVERLVKGLCYLQATDYMAMTTAVNSGQEVSDGLAGALASVHSAGPKRGEPLSSDTMLEAIHNAIHTTGQQNVVIDSVGYELSTTESAGCRFVQIGGTTYIEQNKAKKDSIYAELAQAGHRITWLIGRGKGWGLIIDDRIIRRPSGDKFEERRKKREERLRGQIVVKHREAFQGHWQELTHGILDGVLARDKVYVAGGAVLSCLLADYRRWPLQGKEGKSQSDIDVFICSNNEAEAKETMKTLLDTVTQRLKDMGIPYEWKCRTHTVTLVPRLDKIKKGGSTAPKDKSWTCSVCTFLNAKKSSRCEMCDSPYKPVKKIKVAHRTPEESVMEDMHLPPIQFILYLMGNVTELLCGFDVDCCALAFDGKELLAHPRAIAAISRGVNVVDPMRLSPSFARRLLKYARRGFAAALPGMSPLIAEETKKYVRKIKEEGSKVESLNGLLWLLSKEGRVDGEENHEDDDEDSDEEEDDDEEYSEVRDKRTGRRLRKGEVRKLKSKDSEDEEDDDDEYSEVRDERTGRLLRKSEVKRRARERKRKRRHSSSEEEDDDDEYSEVRDERTGRLLKKSEVRRRREKRRRVGRRAASSDEEEDDDDEYSEERHPETGLLMKKGEIRRMRRDRERLSSKKRKRALPPPSSSSSEEEDEDEEYSEERDPDTGLLMKKSEVRRRDREERRRRAATYDASPSSPSSTEDDGDDENEVESIDLSSSKSGKGGGDTAADSEEKKKKENKVIIRMEDTPVSSIVEASEWHLRRSRFELSMTFAPDWYTLVSPESVMPLLSGYNHWLLYGTPYRDTLSPNRKAMEALLKVPVDELHNLADYDAYFKGVAERLLNGALLHVRGRNSDEGEKEEIYRLREIEFYFYGGKHKDPFTHCSDMQRYAGRWYFHTNPDGSFREDRWRGLDITFGEFKQKDKTNQIPSPKTAEKTEEKGMEKEKEPEEEKASKGKEAMYGGILIRAMGRVRDGALFEGLSVVVEEILRQSQSTSIEDLVKDTHFDLSVGESGSSLYMNRSLYLSLADELDRADIFRCGRVGLSMRKMDGSQPAEDYYALPYRFMACDQGYDVSKWTRGKHYALLGMKEQALHGGDPAVMAQKVGMDDMQHVLECLQWEEEGARDATEKSDWEAMQEYWNGKNFSMDDKTVCRFTGFCRGRKEAARKWWSLPTDWAEALRDEIQSEHFKSIVEFVEGEVKRLGREQIFPPLGRVFASLRLTPLDGVRCVIVGQDPYHTPGMAHGLCFSIRKKVKNMNAIPPSLRNIFEELQSDVGASVPENHGNLERWAQMGVLLLNTTLTVEAHKANSHKACGWSKFTDAIIQKISQAKEKPVVFMLWGEDAQAKASLVDQEKHFVLKAGHPSPLSPVPFKGCKCFSQANELLKSKGQDPIDWNLPPTL